jgi:hypothetical protein
MANAGLFMGDENGQPVIADDTRSKTLFEEP